MEWTGSKCKNDKCDVTDMLNKILENCGTKDISSRIIGCPTIRKCPGCPALIEHEDQCKHIRCPNFPLKKCQVYDFCFCCLETRLNPSDRFSAFCKGPYDMCKIAAT